MFPAGENWTWEDCGNLQEQIDSDKRLAPESSTGLIMVGGAWIGILEISERKIRDRVGLLGCSWANWGLKTQRDQQKSISQFWSIRLTPIISTVYRHLKFWISKILWIHRKQDFETGDRSNRTFPWEAKTLIGFIDAYQSFETALILWSKIGGRSFNCILKKELILMPLWGLWAIGMVDSSRFFWGIGQEWKFNILTPFSRKLVEGIKISSSFKWSFVPDLPRKTRDTPALNYPSWRTELLWVGSTLIFG